MKFKHLFLYTLSLMILISGCHDKQQVDQIIYNARVYTVDAEFTTQEAFAIKDGAFVAVGDSETILKQFTSAETLDVQGKSIYPGFYDAHAHFYGYARTLLQADLMGSQSLEEVMNRLRVFREEFSDTKWLIGRGWDQNLWPVQEFPTRDDLDEAFPDVPVYLVRVDGHAAVVNSKALEIAGLEKARTVEGGAMHAVHGRLTGVLIDHAMGLVSQHIADPTEEEMRVLLAKAEDLCAEAGLTTVNDAGLNRRQLDFLESLYDEGALRIRNHAWAHATPENLEHYLASGPVVKHKFTIRTFKILADGALGSRGACMLEAYNDAPTQGFLLLSPERIDEIAAKVYDSPFQLATHAIGDSTNRYVLNTYATYLNGKNDRRWRIEHAQIVTPEDMDKFGANDILPSVQPTHATSDMFWAIDRVGADRIKGAYAFKPLLDQVGVLPTGSDFPVEHIQPLYGFHAAVARVNANNLPEGGFQTEHALTREEALKGMTIWAAYSFFEENERGSIEEGKAADYVMLEKDIMEVAYDALRDVRVLRTVVDGELLYEAQ